MSRNRNNPDSYSRDGPNINRCAADRFAIVRIISAQRHDPQNIANVAASLTGDIEILMNERV